MAGSPAFVVCARSMQVEFTTSAGTTEHLRRLAFCIGISCDGSPGVRERKWHNMPTTGCKKPSCRLQKADPKFGLHDDVGAFELWNGVGNVL